MGNKQLLIVIAAVVILYIMFFKKNKTEGYQKVNPGDAILDIDIKHDINIGNAKKSKVIEEIGKHGFATGSFVNAKRNTLGRPQHLKVFGDTFTDVFVDPEEMKKMYLLNKPLGLEEDQDTAYDQNMVYSRDKGTIVRKV